MARRQQAVLLLALALCAEAADRVMRHQATLEATEANLATISVDSKGMEHAMSSSSKESQQPYMVMPRQGATANVQYVPAQPRVPMMMSQPMTQPVQMVPAGMAMQQPQPQLQPLQPQPQQRLVYLPPGQTAMQQPGAAYGQPMMQPMMQPMQQPMMQQPMQQAAPQMMRPQATAVQPPVAAAPVMQQAQLPPAPIAPLATAPVAAAQPLAATAPAQSPAPVVAQPAAATATAAVVPVAAAAAAAEPAADPAKAEDASTPARRRTVLMVIVGSINVVLCVYILRRFYFSPYPKNFSGLAAMLQQRRTDNPVPTSALFEESKFKPPSRYAGKRSAPAVRAQTFEDTSSNSQSSEDIEPHQYRNRERMSQEAQ